MSRNLQNTTSRTLRSLGEQVTVHNYDREAEVDEYGDQTPVERPQSPHERVPANVAHTGQPNTNRDSAATRPEARLTVYMRADHAAVENLAGGPDAAPRSRIERETGETLGVQIVLGQHNGLVEVLTEVVG